MPILESPTDEAKRIIEVAQQKKIILRLFGGVSFYFRCPSAKHRSLQRNYVDIDFMGHAKQSKEIKQLFEELGYVPRDRFNAMQGYRRLIFNDIEHQTARRHIPGRLRDVPQVQLQGQARHRPVHDLPRGHAGDEAPDCRDKPEGPQGRRQHVHGPRRGQRRHPRGDQRSVSGEALFRRLGHLQDLRNEPRPHPEHDQRLWSGGRREEASWATG